MVRLNRLYGLTTYLIGGIDRASDLGAGWRIEISKYLHPKGIKVYNPLEKPIGRADEVENRGFRKELKESGRYSEFAELMKDVRHVDRRMVDKSDFIICYIDLDIHLCGTYDELGLATDQCKPVIVLCRQGKKNVPDWLFAQCDHRLFFSSLNEVTEYLDGVNDGSNTEDLGKWLIFDY